MKRLGYFSVAAAIMLGAQVGSAATVFHQLASFEDEIPLAVAPQNGAILTQEALGATDGSFSMGVEFTDTRAGVNDGPQQHLFFNIDSTNDNFNKWNEAANLQLTTARRFAVAYDIYLDFAGTTLPPGATLFASDFRYNQVSDPAATPNPIPGFQDTGGEFGIPLRFGGSSALPTVDVATTIINPFDDDDNPRSFFINPNPADQFYQLQIGHKYDPVGIGGSAKVYYDNFRIIEYSPLQERVLFSWETPDVVGTAENEQLEGWGPGASAVGPPANPVLNHTRSITTVGATDGPSAMKIVPPGLQAGFTWGSARTFTNAAQVNDIAAAIDNAERIEIDLTFDGNAIGTASFFSFFMHVSDSEGHFYQAPASQYEISQLGGGQTDTLKVQFNVREFRNASNLTELMSNDTLLGTTSLAIGIGTNEDSNQMVAISVDKLRIISEEQAAGDDADFDNDQDVDGADFLTWQRNFGGTTGGDANNDGTVNGVDFNIWKQQFGEPVAGAGAVPEPASLAVAAIGLALLAGRRRGWVC